MPTDLEGDWDGQDQSEVFDEDNQTPAGAGDASAEVRTFEDIPEVLDVTQAEGDADDDAALLAEELDDDEIIELEADADMADIEDDDLKTRTAEAFDDDVLGEGDAEEVYHAEEAGLDMREDGGADDADLKFMGDMDQAPAVDSRQATAAESDTVSDDDLEDLGYPGEDEPAQDSEEARAQRRR